VPVKLSDAVVAKRLELIRQLAGTMPIRDIAERLSMSVSNLGNFSRRNGISLAFERKKPAPKKPIEKKPKVDKVPEETRLEQASQLLRSHGWTVFRPDPFLDLKRKQMQGRRE